MPQNGTSTGGSQDERLHPELPAGMSTNTSLLRIGELQELLAICPADVMARCEVAQLLENLGNKELALRTWKEVLRFDPNNLKAWEGIARCRTP